jgi:hypothetical protein
LNIQFARSAILESIMTRTRFVACALLALAASLPAAASAQPSPAGRWEGVISVAGQSFKIVVVVNQAAAGLEATIDVPQQGASGLPLARVRFEAPRLHFELPAGPSLAVFDGTLDGDRVSGSFEQSGAKGTFEMTRTGPPPPAPEKRR